MFSTLFFFVFVAISLVTNTASGYPSLIEQVLAIVEPDFFRRYIATGRSDDILLILVPNPVVIEGLFAPSVLRIGTHFGTGRFAQCSATVYLT